MDPTRTVSAIVVTWNHASFVPVCLEALVAQTYPHMEIIIVDNASQDGTVEWVRAHFPQVRLLEQNRNIGFAAGFNHGALVASGEWLLSVNPDLTPAIFLNAQFCISFLSGRFGPKESLGRFSCNPFR